MDNISILLQILFGGLTSGVAASFPPGKPLGIWGYLIGAVSGLTGGLLFLDLFRPNDTVGSIIAAMFTALLVIFILRLVESNGVDLGGLPTSFNRSSNVPQLAEPIPEKKSNASSFFNIFDEDELAESDHPDTVVSPSLAYSADIPVIGTALEQSPNQTIGNTAFQNPEPESVQPLRGYDEDMFGQGVNSLQGPSFFDTDDEVPTLEASAPLGIDDGIASDKSRLDLALDRLTSDLADPNDDELLVNRLAFKATEDHQDAAGTIHDGPDLDSDRDSAEPTSTSFIAKSFEKTPPSESPVFDDSIFEPELPPFSFDNTGVTDNGTVEDVYGAQYRFDTTPGLPEEQVVEAEAVTAFNHADSITLPEEIPDVSPLHEVALPDDVALSTNIDETVHPDVVPANIESSEGAEKTDSSGTNMTGLSLQEEPLPLRSYDYPDDLTKIKGVSKVYAQRLQAMGIYTWIQVADTEPPLLRDWVAATKNTNVHEWPQLARALAIANDRTDATYNGPAPDDLSEIVGITKKYEQKLNQIGVVSFAQLVEAEAEDIVRGLTEFNIVAAAIYDWQVQAELKLE